MTDFPAWIPDYLIHFSIEWVGVAYLREGAKSPVFQLIGMGSATEVTFTPRDLFSHLLAHQVRDYQLVHFHPSGNSSPSPQDLKTTRKASRLGRELGIQLNSLWIITPKQHRVLSRTELCRRSPKISRHSRLSSALSVLKRKRFAFAPKSLPSKTGSP